MKENIPVITPKIKEVITGIQHRNGVAEIYIGTISRMFNHVLNDQDEIGMSSDEAIATLRVLSMIREDIATLALLDAIDENPDETSDDSIEDTPEAEDVEP